MAKHKTIGLIALLLVISLLTSLPLSLAKVNALVAPIIKYDSKSLYGIILTRIRQFVIDLAGPIVWSTCTTLCYSTFTCPTRYSLVECTSPLCNEAQSFSYPDCRPVLTNSTRAPIQPPPGFCQCVSSTKNPITGVCFSGDVTTVQITLASVNGTRNPTALAGSEYVNICAPNNAKTGLPSVEGVAGFGRTALVSLPARIASQQFFHNEFVLCLPSTSRAPGVAFFGAKPYYFMPSDSPDLSNFLSYTTLLKSPNIYDAAYYLDVSGLAINQKAVSIRRRDLQFRSRGNGGVKLSTTIPHTIMRSKIYKKFTNAFKRATKGIPKMPAVEPFELCFNRSALGSTRLGYAVPAIDIMLNDGKNWTIFGANSIKDVTANTACLAFVDGSKNETTAITLGGFQMENSFLHFDVPNSILGFIPTLLGLRTTCSNFNFTTHAWGPGYIN